MSRVVLSIGSNLGDRLAKLQAAVTDFSPYLVCVSPVYRTPPWGPVEQDDYLAMKRKEIVRQRSPL